MSNDALVADVNSGGDINDVELQKKQELVNRTVRDLVKNNNPRTQSDFLTGLEIEVLSHDQFMSLRNLLNSKLSEIDTRSWSNNSQRKNQRGVISYLG
jgi:hypothetical protein